MDVVEDWEKKEQSIRAYWLGLTDADELDEFESYWFSTEEQATIVSAVRDDLIYDFLVGDLSNSEFTAFRNNFLRSPYHMQMTGLVGAHLVARQPEATEATRSSLKKRLFGIRTWFRPTFQRPAYGFAFGAITLFIAAVATITFIRNSGSPLETASTDPAIEKQGAFSTDSLEQDQPSDQTFDRSQTEIESSGNVADKSHRNSNRSGSTDPEPDETRKPKAPRGSAIVALVLRPQFRGVEGPSSIELPKYVRTVRVSVPTPGIVGDFSGYSAVIVGENGRLVSRQKLPDLSRKIKGSPISLDVPAQIFKAGSHTLKITGKSEREERTLSSYSFEVRRPN